MTEIRKSKQGLVLEDFGYWILEFEIYLKFVILDTKLQTEPSFSDPREAGSSTGPKDQGFQDKINGLMNNNRRKSNIKTSIKDRPDWDDVKDVLNGNKPIFDLEM